MPSRDDGRPFILPDVEESFLHKSKEPSAEPEEPVCVFFPFPSRIDALPASGLSVSCPTVGLLTICRNLVHGGDAKLFLFSCVGEL